MLTMWISFFIILLISMMVGVIIHSAKAANNSKPDYPIEHAEVEGTKDTPETILRKHQDA